MNNDAVDKIEWRTIPDYQNYEVSNTGIVRSKDRWTTKAGHNCYVKGQVLKTFIRGIYVSVALYNGNRKSRKQFAVHRLVAICFIPNPNNYPCVNHKDENPLNNDVTNLEWCTHKYNSNYGTAIKRRVQHQDWDSIADKQSKKVYQYDLEMNLIRTWKSTAECGRNGYSSGCISKCCNMKKDKYKGFIWRYY